MFPPLSALCPWQSLATHGMLWVWRTMCRTRDPTKASSHLPDGCQRVLRCVVPTAPVSYHWNFVGACRALGRVQHLLGPAARYLGEPEHSHKEVEGGGEAGRPQRAPGPQQDEHEDDRVQGDFISELQHCCPPLSLSDLSKNRKEHRLVANAPPDTSNVS